eukprot:COSAG06_NODE_66231_length_255_cov_0.500000_1_plen_34_part_10
MPGESAEQRALREAAEEVQRLQREAEEREAQVRR